MPEDTETLVKPRCRLLRKKLCKIEHNLLFLRYSINKQALKNYVLYINYRNYDFELLRESEA